MVTVKWEIKDCKGIVELAEAVDEGLQLAKVMGQAVASIRRVALSGIGSLDGTIRLGRLGRQGAVRGDLDLAGGLEGDHESGAAVDLLSAPGRQSEFAMSYGGAAQGGGSKAKERNSPSLFGRAASTVQVKVE